MLDKEGRKDGLYLIRKKRVDHWAFALSLCYEQRVRNYEIVPGKDGKIGLKAEGANEAIKQFDDIQSLVQHYSHSQVLLQYYYQ